jgi:hypothetical protein
LDGRGPQPFEHYIGRLSEEFGGALPSVILAELQRLPVGFMEQIVEYRRYAEAHAANRADPKGWERSALRTLAMVIEHELAQADIEQQQQETAQP